MNPITTQTLTFYKIQSGINPPLEIPLLLKTNLEIFYKGNGFITSMAHEDEDKLYFDGYEGNIYSNNVIAYARLDNINL